MATINKKTTKAGKTYYEFIKNVQENGKRVQIKRRFDRLDEAKQSLRELEGKIYKGTYEGNNNKLFKVVIEEWLEFTKPRVKQSTFKTYKSATHNYLTKYLGQKKLKNLNTRVLQDHIDNISVNHNDQELKKGSVQLAKSILHQIFKRLKRRGEIENNPMPDVETPRNLKFRKGFALSREQLITLLDELKSSRYYVAFLIGTNTGMRMAEVLGLTFDNVDLENKVIHIRQQYISADRKLVSSLKTETSAASLRINDNLANAIRELKARVEEEKQTAGDKYEDHNLIVCSNKGKPIHHSTLGVHLHKACEKLGLPKCHFHILRHSFITAVAREVKDPAEASRYARHKSPRTTYDFYVHVERNGVIGSDEVTKLMV
jgi:integrase